MVKRIFWARVGVLLAIVAAALCLPFPLLAQQQNPPSTDTASQGQAKPDEKKDPPIEIQQGAKPEEQKPQNDRLFFVLPNYLTVENAKKIPPLTTAQKFKLVALGTFDPVEFPYVGVLAAIDQAQNQFPSYGQGFKGYAKRFGVGFADTTVENFMVGAVVPSILHEDPRYFQSGKGGFWHRAGYAATRMLIDVSRGQGIQRFLLASTCSVYGASELLMDEHSQVSPISLYAQTKLDSENLLLEARCANFHPTILRLATLFGLSPRPRFDLVVNLLTARAVRLGKITIFNGGQWRPFMHVHDAARAFIACLETNSLAVVSGEIFNAGSSTLNYRLSEVAETIAKVIPAVEWENVENDDRRNYRVSFEKIQSQLGFRCERSLELGIREMAERVRLAPQEDFSAKIFNNQAMTRAFAKSANSERSSIRILEILARTD